MEQLSFIDNSRPENEQVFYKTVKQILTESERTDMPITYASTKLYSTIAFGDNIADIRVSFRKSSSYFAIKKQFKRCLEQEAIPYTLENSGLWFRINIEQPTDILNYKSLINMIYDERYLQNASDSFECCSSYMQCSDLKRCVNTHPNIYRLCKYRAKLNSGIIFYGKNRTIQK